MKFLLIGITLLTSMMSFGSEMDDRLMNIEIETKRFDSRDLELEGKTLVLNEGQSKEEAGRLLCEVFGYSRLDRINVFKNSNCPDGSCYSISDDFKVEDVTKETTYTAWTAPFKAIGNIIKAKLNISGAISIRYVRGTTFGGAKKVLSLTCSKLAD